MTKTRGTKRARNTNRTGANSNRKSRDFTTHRKTARGGKAKGKESKTNSKKRRSTTGRTRRIQGSKGFS